MGEDGLVDAQRLARETIAALNAVVTSAGDAQLLALLTTCETTNRALDQLSVRAIAVLHQRGAFTDRGYRTPGAALGDLLGWERFEARRRAVLAAARGDHRQGSRHARRRATHPRGVAGRRGRTGRQGPAVYPERAG